MMANGQNLKAPAKDARVATAIRFRQARDAASPLTASEIATLERDWTQDGVHHHMGATNTVHRLLATIAARSVTGVGQHNGVP